MTLVDLLNIDTNKIEIEYVSALEYQAKIFHNEIKNRKASAFLYIIEGEYRYTFSNEKFVAKSGNVVYLPRTSSYKYDIVSNKGKCMQFEFNCIYDNEVVFFSENPLLAIENVNNDVQTIFSNIITLNPKESISEKLRLNASVLMLFSFLADKLEGKSFSSSYKKILPAVEYIKNNFTQKIYVKTLERQCNLSASQIRRIFQKELNLSPIEYKNNLLIKSACDMLKGDNTISEISDALGFENIYAFSQFFKKQKGMSPTKYKLTI